MDFITLLTDTSTATMVAVSNMSTLNRQDRALKRAIGNFIAVNHKGAAIVSKMSYHAGREVMDITTPYTALTSSLQSEQRRHLKAAILKSDSLESALLNYFAEFGRYNLSLIPGYGDDQVNELIRLVVVNLIHRFDR